MKKRLLLLAAMVGAIVGVVTPQAHAVNATDYITTTNSLTNDLLNRVPGLGGPPTRNVCVIDNAHDRSYCVYVTLP